MDFANSNHSYLNSSRAANFTQRVKQRWLNLFIPEKKQVTIDNPNALKFIDFCADKLSSSYNQRLILGATALATQPFIDLNNKKVDEKTRKVSVCRTLAKILVGTATGYTIRKLCVKSIDAFTQNPKDIPSNAKFKELKCLLRPTVEHTAEQLAQHKNTLGTLMALGVMLYTNFLVDAPLTLLLTNYFNRNLSNGNNEKKARGE